VRTAAVTSAIALLAFASCAKGGATFSEPIVAEAWTRADGVDPSAIRPNIDALVGVRQTEVPAVSIYSLQAPLTHTGSAGFLADAFKQLGLDPVTEPFSSGGLDGANVYVEFPGDTPELVLVTGHHDAWFQSGADDNGSAIAVLIEAARALKGGRFHRTIRLIGLDREEEGSVGAVSYLTTHAGDSIRMVLNMDCVGYASDEAGSQDAPPGFALRDVGNFLAVLANKPAYDDASRFVRLAGRGPKPVEVLGLLPPGDSHYAGVGDFLRSDHSPFWLRGIPALFLTDTANFRNHNYHTPDDTAEKLNYEFLGRVSALVAGAAVAFAESE
jgi:hypothetical protein